MNWQAKKKAVNVIWHWLFTTSRIQGVDLHRNLNQIGRFVAAKSDPISATQVTERWVAINQVAGQFSNANVGSIRDANQQWRHQLVEFVFKSRRSRRDIHFGNITAL
jgi:hypothetical protein